MTGARQEAGGEPHAPEVIRPGPDAESPVDVAAGAQRKKDKLPSPTERYEARVDNHIAELKRDKQQLEDEVRRLRIQEIHHLREDVRWLEDFKSGSSGRSVRGA